MSALTTPARSTLLAGILILSCNSVDSWPLSASGRHDDVGRKAMVKRSTCTSGLLGDLTAGKPGILNQDWIPSTNCKDIYDFGMTDSGLYHINLGGNNKRSFTVFCDMSLNGGGWMVIQRRVSDSISFNRNWTEYRNGFGQLNGGNFWLGLQNIHEITSSEAHELYIGMESYHPSQPTQAASAYSYFSVGDESSKYALSISGFYDPDPVCKGGDSLTVAGGTNHNGQAFSTPDQDNDKDTDGHCAERFCSGWWYHDCHDSHLNGKWYADGELANINEPDGIIWESYRGDTESLITVVMAIRPV